MLATFLTICAVVHCASNAGENKGIHAPLSSPKSSVYASSPNARAVPVHREEATRVMRSVARWLRRALGAVGDAAVAVAHPGSGRDASL